MKVFVDGAFSLGSSVVGCGGVVRDLEAFMYSVYGSSSVETELWGCLWGLRRAWDSGFRHVSLFSDAVSVVEGLEHGVSELHEYADLFAEVGKLLRHQWIVELRVISREDNVAADFLAKSSFNYSLGIHVVPKADVVHLSRM